LLWFNHPAYTNVCVETLQKLKRRRARLKRLRPIIFLCGAKDSDRRDRLNEYLQKFSDFLIFYAEEVFGALAQTEPGANALQLEKELAELADAVVIIAESPGTFAELGAFAISDDLRLKLLPIADKAFERDESFLRVGPIRWTDRDSAFGPTVWTDFSVILGLADKIKERLEKGIRRPTPIDVKQLTLRNSRRHMLFSIVLLLEIYAPVSIHQLRVLLEEIVGPVPLRDVQTLLGLAEALNLAKSEHFEGERLHFRWHRGGRLGQTNVTPFAIGSLRTHVLSVMQTIPSATRALDFLAEKHRSAA
jgi:hypothetical protein